MAPPNRSDLVARIAGLAARAGDPDGLHLLNPASSRYAKSRRENLSGIPQSELDAVGRDIAIHLGLPPDDLIHISLPNGGASWRSPVLASRAVARSRFRDADEVMATFEEAVRQNATDIMEVIALWGIHPRRAVDVGSGVTLTPMSEVPPSAPRDILLGISSHASPQEEEGAFYVRARPTAALVRTFSFGPLLAQDPAERTATGTASRQEEMLDMARCLTLVSDRAVRQIGTWFQAPEDHPIVPGVGGWGGQAITWGDQFEVPAKGLNGPQIRSLVASYLAFGNRARLQIVLDRLNAAKMPQTLEDRAVDLGVSLEALLFNPKDIPSEISLKFKLRGAVLASDDPQERKRVFRLLDRLYTLKSTAAHGSIFDPEDTSLTSDLTAGLSLASQLIRRVLQMRQLPESWNGLILGWEQLPTTAES